MDKLKFAVIHELIKERGVTTADKNLRDELLDVSKPLVARLASLLSGLLGRDQSEVYWGQFGDRRREGQFPSAVVTFSEEMAEARFLELSRTAMTELVDLSAKESWATGGFIFFAAYELRNVDYLLVAMIKERDGIALTEDFEPEEINEVDLSKLHQAACINLHTYLDSTRGADKSSNDGVAADDDEKITLERTYLRFINRKGRDDVAEYFIKALGCEKGVSSARATKGVIKAVRKYVKGNASIAVYAPQARQAVIDYMDTLPEGAMVTLDNIYNVVSRVIAVDKVEHLSGLKAFLNDEAQQIPEDFQVSKRALKAYARIAAHTDRWNFNFESSALGINEGEIIYNTDRHTLTITRIPPAMIKKIEDTLRDRNQLPKGE